MKEGRKRTGQNEGGSLLCLPNSSITCHCYCLTTFLFHVYTTWDLLNIVTYSSSCHIVLLVPPFLGPDTDIFFMDPYLPQLQHYCCLLLCLIPCLYHHALAIDIYMYYCLPLFPCCLFLHMPCMVLYWDHHPTACHAPLPPPLPFVRYNLFHLLFPIIACAALLLVFGLCGPFYTCILPHAMDLGACRTFLWTPQLCGVPSHPQLHSPISSPSSYLTICLPASSIVHWHSYLCMTVCHHLPRFLYFFLLQCCVYISFFPAFSLLYTWFNSTIIHLCLPLLPNM